MSILLSIVLGVCLLILLLSVGSENGVLASVVSLVLGGIWYLAGMPGWVWLLANWQTALVGAGLFFLIGCLWGFVIKWYLFCVSEKEELVNSYGYKQNPSREKLENLLKQLTFAHYANKITLWVLFWPFSVVATIFDDVLGKLVKFAASLFRKTMERIAKFAFRDVL